MRRSRGIQNQTQAEIASATAISTQRISRIVRQQAEVHPLIPRHAERQERRPDVDLAASTPDSSRQTTAILLTWSSAKDGEGRKGGKPHRISAGNAACR